jgi:hypothetical protein
MEVYQFLSAYGLELDGSWAWQIPSSCLLMTLPICAQLRGQVLKDCFFFQGQNHQAYGACLRVKDG